MSEAGRTTMATIVVYEALYTFDGKVDDLVNDIQYIAIQTGDIVEVDSFTESEVAEGLMENPGSWLHGRNLRTGRSGCFPGNYVKFLSVRTCSPVAEMSMDDSGFQSPRGKVLGHRLSRYEFVLWVQMLSGLISNECSD